MVRAVIPRCSSWARWLISGQAEGIPTSEHRLPSLEEEFRDPSEEVAMDAGELEADVMESDLED